MEKDMSDTFDQHVDVTGGVEVKLDEQQKRMKAIKESKIAIRAERQPDCIMVSFETLQR
jgi:predicted metalloprotease